MAKCSATTSKRTQCMRDAMRDSTYCWQHHTAIEAEATSAVGWKDRIFELTREINFKWPFNIVLAGCGVIMLIIGVLTNSNAPLYLQISIFITYTVLFSIHSDFEEERNIKTVISHTEIASRYISHFLPFYGFFIGVMFAIDEEKKSHC